MYNASYFNFFFSHLHFESFLDLRRVSELEEPSEEDVAGGLSPLDCRGVAMGCFVLARSLQLGQAVSKNDLKAHEYFAKVKHQVFANNTNEYQLTKRLLIVWRTTITWYHYHNYCRNMTVTPLCWSC